MIAALVCLGIGVLGLRDVGKRPYAGFEAARDFNVVRVRAGSPADEAGLEVGDVIKVIGGIPVQDSKARWRQPRPEIGETRTYCVKRAGEIQEVDITFTAQPSTDYLRTGLGIVVGLCFLGFTLWAYLTAPSASTVLLALFGLCFGLEFFPSPYSHNFTLRSLAEALGVVVIVAGFAFLIHYLMLFPRRRGLLDRPWGLYLIYLPAALMALFMLSVILVQPDFTSRFRLLMSVVSLIFIVGYFGGALVTIFFAYLRSNDEERAASGLGLMLVGTVIGLVPILSAAVLGVVNPAATLPGDNFYHVALVLIPVSFALAAVRSARSTAV